MNRPKISICDANFLPFGKSASMGGDNIDRPPKYFDWVAADAQTASFVTDGSIEIATGKGQIAWLLEPMELHPENYQVALARQDEFDAIFSFQLPKGEINRKKWRKYFFGGSWINFDDWGTYKKSKSVSMIMSSKDYMPGHKIRHEIAKKLEGQIDIFGRDVNPIERKFDALAPYRYSIVVESASSPLYFTEKLIDCLSVGTIPIYWGCSIPQFYFDTEGMLILETPDDLEHAMQMTRTLDHFIACEPAIKRNIELAKKYRTCEDWIYENYYTLLENYFQ